MLFVVYDVERSPEAQERVEKRCKANKCLHVEIIEVNGKKVEKECDAPQERCGVAWDNRDDDRDKCVAAINRAYGPTKKNGWYNSRDRFFSDNDADSFDLAVMCSTLHEIEPTKWLEVFGGLGLLSSALHAEGWLLVVEDYLIPHGELAHRYGYVVLNAEQLKALFCIEANDHFESIEAKLPAYAGRIRGHLIPAVALSRISAESRARALRLASVEASDQIQELRSVGPRTYKDGMAHAFWTQQFANCELALRHFVLLLMEMEFLDV